MSKHPKKQLMQTMGWLLAGLILFGGGCSRRPRSSTLPRSPSAGFNRVSGADTAHHAGETGETQADSAGVVSNTATTLQVTSEDETVSELDGAIAVATEQLLVDAHTEETETAEKASSSYNPLRRLMNWKNSETPPSESPDKVEDENEVAQSDEEDPTSSSEEEEVSKPPVRTRGQRLLSMLRFPWGNEPSDAEVDETDLEDPESEPETLESLPGLGESVDQLTDGAEIPEEIGVVAVDETVLENVPVIRGPQPWSESQPQAAPTGVTNQAITTLADYQFDEDAEGETEAQSLGSSEVSFSENSADRPRLSGQFPGGERPLGEERTSAPVEALRRAIFPESLQSEVKKNELNEPAEVLEPPTATVVQIPNRLPAPEVRGIAKAWPTQLASRNALLIASVVGVGLLLAWGIWRRARARDEA